MTDFKSKVISIVCSIPKGMVMSYGSIAAIAGSPRSARIVGGIAHFGDPSIPWHRVVNRNGGTAKGYPGGKVAHQIHLENEGIVFEDGYLNMKEHQWNPTSP